MSIPEIDPATFVVPANQLLVYKSGDLFYGKKSNEATVEVDTDDMIRMDLTAADLPCLIPEYVYTEAHAAPAMENLDKSSAFTKTAAYKFAKMVKDQKASKAELATTTYEIKELINSTGEDVAAERARAEAAEAGLQDNITALDSSIIFKKLIDRIWIYGSDVYDLNYMVGTGIYYCSTDASVVGTAMTNMPEGTAEGILIVTKNSQVFIEGGTAKGRMYYRYQTGAGSEVSEYTEDWVAGAMLSDVTSLDTEIKAIIGTLPAGKTVAEAIADAASSASELRTAVEATAGAGAIAVTAGADAATKNIALTLDGTSLSQSTNGLKAELVLKKQDTAETGFAATYFLTDATGTNVYGSKINLIKDQFLKGAVIFNATEDEAPAGWSGDAYVKGHKYFKFTWEITKGSPDTDDDTVVYLDVESLVDSYTSGSTAINVNNEANTIALVIDNTTVETAEGVNTTVLVQTANGLKAQGIQEAIDYAVSVESSRATLAEEAIASDLSDEVSARETAVSGEASAREAADSALNTALRAEIAKKVDHRIANGDGSEALIFNESDGGGAKFTTSTGFISFVGVNDGTDGLYGQIYALSKNAQGKYEGVRLNVQSDKITYKNNGLYADSFDAKYELAVKNDITEAQSDLTEAIATAKSEAISAAESKDAARYITVTADIAAAKEAVEADLAAETAARIAADNTKVTTRLASESGGSALIFNEADGGGAKIERTNGDAYFVGVNDSDGDRSQNHAVASIYALNNSMVGIRFTVFKDMITYKANATKAERNNGDYELAVKADVASAQATVQGNLNTHAALDSRHTAPIEFVRTAATISELAFKRYICKATLDGTLPAAPADGTEVIVKVVAGGEATVIRAASGDKIDDGSVSGASVVALNYSNQTYDFIYDADAKLWYIL